MNTSIDINLVNILGPDLKSRSSVDDLCLYMKNSKANSFKIDFLDVQFATRSFMDEFYNKVLVSSVFQSRVTLLNVSSDLQMILDAVKGTQTTIKKPKSSGRILKFKSIEEVNQYLKNLAF